MKLKIHVLATLLLSSMGYFVQAQTFNYDGIISGKTGSLIPFVAALDKDLGVVQVSGVDTKSPTTPFKFEWGDGSSSSGFFPINHTYSDKTKDYSVRVTATYSDGSTDMVIITVFFISSISVIQNITLPPELSISMPNSNFQGLSGFPNLIPFKEGDFGTTPKDVILYVMKVCAMIENNMINQDVKKVNNQFSQIILHDPITTLGGYSLWFSEPVGLVMKTQSSNIAYSSFFHEMGHNFTLNSPEKYIAGGKIDGNANAIFSESLAQIFQHTAGYEILNNTQYFGIGNLVSETIKNDINSSFSFLKNQYDLYVAGGKKYASWNDPSTSGDEAFGTFLTIGYKFIEYGNSFKTGYRLPTQRLMKFIQNVFDADTRNKYDPQNNTDLANKFRATFMVAAISAGYGRDFRQDFRNLNFPIDDDIYNQLVLKANLPVWVGINGVSSLKLCTNNTSNLDILTLGGTPSNNYFIELSDVNGNFNLPIKVGNISIGVPQSSITIPANVTVGNRYRLRVVSNDRSFTNEFPFDISINSISPPSIQPPSSTVLCKDASITLSVIPTNGFSYQWQRDGNKIDGATNATYAVTQSGNYNILATANGCSSNSLPIVVQASNLSVKINTAVSSICPNELITIDATLTGNSAKIQWKLDDKELAGEINTKLIATQTGTYILTASAEGCSTISNSLVVKAKQVKPNIIQDGFILSTLSSQKGYQWYLDKIVIQGATSQTFTASKSGKYSVSASPEGCESTLSDEVAIVILATNTFDLSESIELTSFPNPLENIAEIQFNLPKPSKINLQLYNESGIKIKSLVEGSYSAGRHNFTLNSINLISGTYFFILETDYGSKIKKMLVLR
jgi:hypothetical protein